MKTFCKDRDAWVWEEVDKIVNQHLKEVARQNFEQAVENKEIVEACWILHPKHKKLYKQLVDAGFKIPVLWDDCADEDKIYQILNPKMVDIIKQAMEDKQNV